MIPLVKPFLRPADELIPEIQKTLYSGYIAQGEKVNEFESAFTKFIGGGNSLSVNSGTAALHIALILAGVKDGDEVISTALTAEPTNVAIRMVGADIRYADIDPNTGNSLPSSVEERINSKTKAILVVDYAGIPVDVSSLQTISKKYDIPIIEDAAHALGSECKRIKAGNHFPFTIFSFQAIKHMTTIDGGMLQISDREMYDQGKLVRWFGLDKGKSRLENNIQLQGFKYHMNDVNATIGISQLEVIGDIIEKHCTNGLFFDQALRNVSGITCLDYYAESKPSYWLYTMKVENREGLIRKLGENGISASTLHRRNDLHDYLAGKGDSLPNLDDFYDCFLHTPCGWWVTEEDREKIVEVITSGW